MFKISFIHNNIIVTKKKPWYSTNHHLMLRILQYSTTLEEECSKI